MRQIIGEARGGGHAESAFMMLDAPHLQLQEVEGIFASAINICGASTAPSPKPAEPEAQAQPQAPAPAAFKPHYKDWKAARRKNRR